MFNNVNEVLDHINGSRPPSYFAKEGAIFHDAALDSRPRRIIAVDPFEETITYEPVGDGEPFTATVPEATFNHWFRSWVEDETNERAEFYANLRKSSAVWDVAHRENEERFIKDAVTRGDAAAVLSFLDESRRYNEDIIRILTDYASGCSCC